MSSYNKKYNAAKTISNFFLVAKKAEAGAFGNNIEKEPQKHTQNWKNSYIFTEHIYAPCNPIEMEFWEITWKRNRKSSAQS